jgi:beta-N-acetylhexosaminidase
LKRKKSSMESGDLAQQVGQLLVIGFDGTEMSPQLASLLSRIQPAGVILFGRNIVSAQQTYKLLKDCRDRILAQSFTCVDLEGGRVDRFREVFGRSPSAADVFATGRRALFRKHGKLIGQCCRALGFNTDFAPVVDLALEASRAVMSSRAVSADPKQVVAYAREFLVGLESGGVIGCIKHFPGLGEAYLDTHEDLPSVNKDLKKLWDEDIFPYRALRRDSPMILIGHASYPQVTKDTAPASLSKKWITDVLRKRVGYRGLIVSDDLEMGGVLKAAPIERAAEQFIRAGGDLCLICHKEEYVTRSYEHLVAEAERDSRFARRVLESAGKIKAFRRKNAAFRLRAPKPSETGVDKLKRSLGEFSEEVRLAGMKRQNMLASA